MSIDSNYDINIIYNSKGNRVNNTENYDDLKVSLEEQSYRYEPSDLNNDIGIINKVDTEEINYDDIYQITIKIDKRDFN